MLMLILVLHSDTGDVYICLGWAALGSCSPHFHHACPDTQVVFFRLNSLPNKCMRTSGEDHHDKDDDQHKEFGDQSVDREKERPPVQH